MFTFDSYILAWSKSQNTFFIEHLSVHIETNLRYLAENHSSDLMVVGIFPTHKEAVEMHSKLIESYTHL